MKVQWQSVRPGRERDLKNIALWLAASYCGTPMGSAFEMDGAMDELGKPLQIVSKRKPAGRAGKGASIT
jgi:hypothetical protein